jgi:hypothetical protein
MFARLWGKSWLRGAAQYRVGHALAEVEGGGGAVHWTVQNREPPEREVAAVAAQGEVPREEPLPHGWERLDRGSPALASRACRAGSKGERHGCQRPRAEEKMEQGGALR